jgi:hypothetical protein
MPSGTVYHVAVVQTDVLENTSPPSSGFLRSDRIPQLCYHGIAVDQPHHKGILIMVKEHCLLGCFHGSECVIMSVAGSTLGRWAILWTSG